MRLNRIITGYAPNKLPNLVVVSGKAWFDFESVRNLDTTHVVRMMSAFSFRCGFNCMRFHLYPLSKAFSNRCVFDENTRRFSVD